MSEAEIKLSHAYVTAPVAGFASREYRTVGNLITAGSQDGSLLTVVNQNDPIYANFAIPSPQFMRLRALQDETGGFQTFICFPFLPKHTELGEHVKQTSMWDDLRTMAISRLMLDNFKNIKAYWVMLTVPVAQVALGFGANDIDGTVHKETILHDAGAKSPRALSEDNIIRIIKEAGRIPAACDCNFNILRIIE